MAVTIITKNSTTASKRPTAAQLIAGELGLNYESSDPGLYFEDSAGNVRKIGGCHYGATAPNSAAAGQVGNSIGELWYDTVNTTLYVWDGAAWTVASAKDTHSFIFDGGVNGANGVPTLRNDGSALLDGDIWWDSTSLESYIYYDDGTSQQWVQQIAPNPNAGSVSSVNVTGANGIVVSGSPITTSGTISLSIDVNSLPPIP